MARLAGVALGAAVSLAAVGQPPYSVEWDRGYGDVHYACAPDTAALDGGQGLWAVCDGHDYAKDRQVTTLYKIDADNGDLKVAKELTLPLPSPLDYWNTIRLTATSGVPLVLSSGVGMTNFDGVFIARVNSDGSTNANLRVVPEGSQLQDAAPTSDGNLLIAADQRPMSVRKVTPSGKAMWTRLFGAQLWGPDLTIFPDDSSCVSAEPSQRDQTRPVLQLIRLDPMGRVAQQVSIAAAQGAVAAGPEGTCTVLYSDTFGPNSRVRIAGYDAKLQRIWDAPTPLTGRLGRDYALDVVSDGYVAIGETSQDLQNKVLVKLSWTGAVEWTTPLPRGLQKAVIGKDEVFLTLFDIAADHRDAAFHVQKLTPARR